MNSLMDGWKQCLKCKHLHLYTLNMLAYCGANPIGTMPRCTDIQKQYNMDCPLFEKRRFWQRIKALDL